MPQAQSAAQPALLIVHSDDASHAVEPGQGVVTIGREPHADLQIDVRREPGGEIGRAHGQRRIAGTDWLLTLILQFKAERVHAQEKMSRRHGHRIFRHLRGKPPAGAKSEPKKQEQTARPASQFGGKTNGCHPSRAEGRSDGTSI